ncbi:hypothetical protein KPL70_015522 [Citrus sinensis]|nr:hypothetical protein KPL70_015522 [Citrus sinensis]
MTHSVFPKLNSFIMSIILIFMAISCCCCFSGSYAANNPAEALANAYLCFNDRFQYRLNESGNINVPPGATDLFCNGLCFKETHVMLDCVEKLLSNFNFYNKATVKDIRKALNSGCSYTSQRGGFNVLLIMTDKECLLFNGYMAMLTGSCLLICLTPIQYNTIYNIGMHASSDVYRTVAVIMSITILIAQNAYFSSLLLYTMYLQNLIRHMLQSNCSPFSSSSYCLLINYLTK